MTAEEKSWLRLHLTPGLGRTALIRLMDVFGSAQDILKAGPEAWIGKAAIRPDVAHALPATPHPRVEKALCDLEKLQVSIIPLSDSSYPSLLKTIHDPPALLYVRGKLSQDKTLAVVGARRASDPGRELAFEICTELASRGITIVSGLARGIDTAAHSGALEGGGVTVGIFGCGIDRVYPRENAHLLNHILEKGAVLSEYPPGTPPLPGHFPGRNRIISGLSRGVLVVEAAEESGSLITAEFALEHGREVFAVPGPVHASGSRGVNQLLKDGAHVVTESRDILEVLWPGIPSVESREAESAFASRLSGDAHRIYEFLGREPLAADEIVRKCGLTPMEVFDILLHLELQGGIEQLPGMRFVRALRR